MFLTGNNVDNLTKIEQHDAVKIIKGAYTRKYNLKSWIPSFPTHTSFIIFYKGCDRIISSISEV